MPPPSSVAECAIGAGSVIEEGVKIGDGTVVYPNCFVGPGCRDRRGLRAFSERRALRVDPARQIASDCIRASFSARTVSAMRLALKTDRSSRTKKSITWAVSIVGDDVEIGAGSTIDRGTIGDTRIDRGAKIDNNVQIGHNCHVGEGAVMCGMSGLAGSAELGKFVYVGALAGLGNQVVVGDRSKVGPGTLVGKDVPPGTGRSWAIPHRDPKDFYKMHALFNQMLEEHKEESQIVPSR